MRAPADAARTAERIRKAVGQVVRGKDEAVGHALVTLAAGGHLLIEDLPGVGKTSLAHALARAVGGTFRRIQFTSDLLPADLLGVSIYRRHSESFEFQPGPVFANVVLADELNRAPPRTQSALLEAMEERTVTVDGTMHPLPSPFFVLATQNPLEHHGTYDLPESQRDRFLMCIGLGYASPRVEVDLMVSAGSVPAGRIDPVASPADIARIQQAAREVTLHPELARYAQGIVDRTRSHPALRIGASTRGALSWVGAARARALLDGRTYVVPDDLQALAVPVLAHRLVPAAAASDATAAAEVVREIVADAPVPT